MRYCADHLSAHRPSLIVCRRSEGAGGRPGSLTHGPKGSSRMLHWVATCMLCSVATGWVACVCSRKVLVGSSTQLTDVWNQKLIQDIPSTMDGVLPFSISGSKETTRVDRPKFTFSAWYDRTRPTRRSTVPGLCNPLGQDSVRFVFRCRGGV